jgi:hypothetical protein
MKEEQDLIILSVYLNVDGLSNQQVHQQLADLINNYTIYFKDSNKNIKIMWFPVVNQNTRVECIYPPSNMISKNEEVENELLNIYKLLVNLKNDEAKDIIRDIERKLKFKKIISKLNET